MAYTEAWNRDIKELLHSPLSEGRYELRRWLRLRSSNSEFESSNGIRAFCQGKADDKSALDALRGEEQMTSKSSASGFSSSSSPGRLLPPSSGRPSVVSVRSLLSSEDSRQHLAEFGSFTGEKSFHGKEEMHAMGGGMDRRSRPHDFSYEWVTEWSNQGLRKSPDSRNFQPDTVDSIKSSVSSVPTVQKHGGKRETNPGVNLKDVVEERSMLDVILQNSRAQGRQRRSLFVEPVEELPLGRSAEEFLPSPGPNGVGFGINEVAGDVGTGRTSEASGSPSVFRRQRGHYDGRDHDVQGGSSRQQESRLSSGSERGEGADARSVAELIRRFREGPPSRRGDRVYPSIAVEKADFHNFEEERRREATLDMIDDEALWESLYCSEDENGVSVACPFPSRGGYRGRGLLGETESTRSRGCQRGGRPCGQSEYDLRVMRERTHTMNGGVSVTLAPVRRLLWPSEEKPHDSFVVNRGARGLPVDGQVLSEGEGSSPGGGSSPLQFDGEDVLEKWRRKRSGAAIASHHDDAEAELTGVNNQDEKTAGEEWDLNRDESEFLQKVRQRLGMATFHASALESSTSPCSTALPTKLQHTTRRDQAFDGRPSFTDTRTFPPDNSFSSPPTGRSPLGRSPPPLHESSLASRRGIHPTHLKLSPDEAALLERVNGQAHVRASRPTGTFSPPRPKARPIMCHTKTLMDDSRSSPSPSSSPSILSPSFPSPPDSPILSPPPIVTLPRHLARAAPVTIETPFPPGLPHLTCRVSGLGTSGLGSPPAKAVGSPTRGRRRGSGDGAWDVDLRRALLSLGDPKRDPTSKASRKTSPAVSAMISETVDDWLLGDEFPTCSWGMDVAETDIIEPAADPMESVKVSQQTQGNLSSVHEMVGDSKNTKENLLPVMKVGGESNTTTESLLAVPEERGDSEKMLPLVTTMVGDTEQTTDGQPPVTEGSGYVHPSKDASDTQEAKMSLVTNMPEHMQQRERALQEGPPSRRAALGNFSLADRLQPDALPESEKEIGSSLTVSVPAGLQNGHHDTGVGKPGIAEGIHNSSLSDIMNDSVITPGDLCSDQEEDIVRGSCRGEAPIPQYESFAEVEDSNDASSGGSSGEDCFEERVEDCELASLEVASMVGVDGGIMWKGVGRGGILDLQTGAEGA